MACSSGLVHLTKQMKLDPHERNHLWVLNCRISKDRLDSSANKVPFPSFTKPLEELDAHKGEITLIFFKSLHLSVLLIGVPIFYKDLQRNMYSTYALL